MTDYTGDTYTYDDSPATGNVVIVTPPANFVTEAELAAHTDLTTTAHGSIVPSSRRITINSQAYDLSADRVWNITSTGAGIGMQVTSADNTGATDATAQLQADLATAVAAGHKRLYLPAGTYTLARTSGTLLNITTNNVEVFGDGIGKTILQVPAATALTADLTLIQLAGRQQWLHDFSIQVGAGASGAFNMYGVSVTNGAFYPRLTRIEVSGVYGTGTAGGACFSFYQSATLQFESTTTLGTAIAAGTRTVTPGTMTGIYIGSRLLVGGTSENVVVTGITETTFTAVFANAHGATDGVFVYCHGNQYALMEDCIARDAYYASGVVVDSSSNVFRRIRIMHVGSTSTMHGFYLQGGYNYFESCYVEGAYGYSYHGHKQVPVIDGSGDVFVGCYSVNPRTNHFIADSLTSDGTNPNVPNGTELTRSVALYGCVFRRTKDGPACSGLNTTVPASFIGCIFEDVTGADFVGWINGTNGLIMQGCHFRGVNHPAAIATLQQIIICNTNAIIDGNRFENLQRALHVKASTNCRITNNIFLMGANAVGAVTYEGDTVLIAGNYISSASGACLGPTGTRTGIDIRGNTFDLSSTATVATFDANTAGAFSDNRILGTKATYTTLPNLIVDRNDGQILHRSNTGTAITRAAGRLLAFAKNSSALSTARLVKLSSGALAPLTTSDTTFAGATISAHGTETDTILIAGQVGAECAIDCDGAWAAGNMGIASTTAAGKIHDNGSSPPASGSYVLFLDTGGSAGTARCMLVKTL